jgi:hypothetical protein
MQTMRALKKIIFSLGALILFSTSVLAQEIEQRATSSPLGGRWMSSGTISHFSSVGQTAAQSGLVSADSVWSGTVGFVMPTLSLEPNEPPVAVSLAEEVFYEAGQSLILEGYDPEDDPIAFEVVSPPALGTVSLIEGTDNEYIFTPNTDLQPDTDYSDILEFVVRETSGAKKSSETAQVRFAFRVEDAGHVISGLTFNSNSGAMELMWNDAKKNASYGVNLAYYDLSDIQNPDIKELYNDTSPLENYTVIDDQITFNFDVDAGSDPYLFNGNKVFVTALVTTENGNSDFLSFVIDNTSGGRINTSEDGLFFAYGSRMTVKENNEVQLRLVGVELGDFDLSQSSIEILQIASQGTLGAPTVSEVTANTKIWLLNFKATQEVGGLDSIQFRLFHPDRQQFDTAWALIEIKDVNDPPKVTRIADQRTVEEMPFVVDLKYLDPDNDVDILVESNMASKVLTSYENGQITITPVQDFSGQVSVNVVITEKGTQESYVAFDRFDVEVEAVNDPPEVTAVADQTVDEDNSLTIALSATDVDARIQLFDYAVEMSEPSSFKVGIDGSTVRIVPNANVNGTFTVSVFADDRQGTATSRSAGRTFTLNINAVNDKPEIIKSFTSQKIVQGFPAYTLNMGAYFNDVEDGANLTYTPSGNDKIGLSFDGAIMTVTPAADFSGVEDVIVQASDGELSVEQAVTFVSLQQNADIQVVSDPGTITLEEDFGTYTFDLSDVFADQNNSGAVFSFDLIGGNFLNVSIDETTGLLTVVAPDNYNGVESIYLVGSAGGQSGYTTFEINVNPVNDAPIIGALQSQVIQEDLSVSGLFVELSDIDNDFPELSITASSSDTALLPNENISVVAGSGGYTIGVMPAANKSGTALVTLTGSDGSLEVTSSFRVNVQAVNDRPEVIVTSINSATEDQPYSLGVSSLFSDIEGDALTFEATELPDWATYNAGFVVGTPTNDDVDTWVLTVKADDGNGGTVTASYQLPVANVNDAPELVSGLGSITAFQEDDWVFNFPMANFRDIDTGDVLTYSFDKFPDWATVSGTQLSGMPGYDDIGDYELIMSVTDVAGEKVTDVATLSVAFTIYDVIVAVAIDQECSSGKKTVSASGAHTYNWYDTDGNLIGAKQESLILESGMYEVVGVDAMDNTAPARVSFEVVKCVVLNIAEPEMAIYPNPTSDWLYIKNLPENVEIWMFDALGRMHNLDFQKVGSGFKVDMTMMPSGMYFIKTNVSNDLWKVIKKG